MNNILYVIPNLSNVSGGPKTRVSLFKNVFLNKKDDIIEKGNKIAKSVSFKKVNIVYVESATNRIALVDFFCLLFLRLRSKKVIVFIRDVYIEMFPEEYANPRAKITLIVNKLSNFYLTLISTNLVFPSIEMGDMLFKNNSFYIKKPYQALPPATYNITENKQNPDFSKKTGILYLGSTKYQNSGFNTFLDFEKKYQEQYNFYVLSGDSHLNDLTKGTTVKVAKIPRDTLPAFIKENNIAYAFHTRPRNSYDDLTFPIKVFDFLSFQLPFISEKHIPLEKLLSNQYQLFVSMNNLESIHEKIQRIDEKEYSLIVDFLKEIAINNTYQKRYDQILEI